MTNNGRVHLTVREGVAHILIDRPQARNAMTWAMYEELAAACAAVRADDTIRIVTFRGAGGEAFVAGTDIEQFRSFQGAEDGIAYERTIDERIGQIEALPMPTICVVEGWAMGGGMAIAAACDFRIATPKATFGVPIAKTLGNCLSIANMTRLVAAFGASRAKRMLMLADTVSAQEARDCGFVTELVEPAELDAAVQSMCERLAKHAPLTMRVSKEGIRRIVANQLPEGEDLIRTCYGSRDFRTGVEAFMEKRRPEWTGS
jgi:enoyl-CoA hydratase/carnithine racemase